MPRGFGCCCFRLSHGACFCLCGRLCRGGCFRFGRRGGFGFGGGLLFGGCRFRLCFGCGSGFGFGGFGMVAALVAYVEGRFSWRATAAGCVAVLLIIAIYDLPFEDLILPPNGDV